ncbi:MAG TPA: hypothetical protein DCQ68_01910 [Chryseobacterium indologenes]|nr:hypothetical protein [Chryseobacterium indologenes]
MVTTKIEIDPGTTIHKAFVESIRIAKILKCKVQFVFNGVICIAHPNGSPDVGVESWQNTHGKSVKIAFSV